MCYDILCPAKYEPKLDVLNAAQSGAMIPNLVTHEWSYMLEQLKAVGTVCVCVIVFRQNFWQRWGKFSTVQPSIVVTCFHTAHSD